MRFAPIALSLAALSLLSGCAGLSPTQQLIHENRKIDLPTRPITDHQDVVKLSYLGNRMMSDSARRKLMENLGESLQAKAWVKDSLVSGANTSTTARMLADASASQFGSAAGLEAGAAGFAAGFLLSSLSNDNIDNAGQVFFPNEMYGKQLITQDDARRAMDRLAREQITAVADKLSWELSCVVGCEVGSGNVAYRLTGSPEHPASSDFAYAPSDVVLTANIEEMEAVESRDPLRALLGFAPAWKTSGPSGLWFSAYSDLMLNSNGRVMVTEADDGPDGLPSLPKASDNLSGTHFGIALKAALYDTPYAFGGHNTFLEKMFYYNGESYSFDSFTDVDFINLRVDVPELTTVYRSAGATTDNEESMPAMSEA